MNTQRKRFEKDKRRERALRVERQRRFEKDQCAELMMWADFAWRRKDFEDCQRWLEKALKIRPHFAEALEWAAEVAFRRDRSEEGLAYYERLREAPKWPPLTFFAAHAASKLRRLDESEQLLAEFLSQTNRRKRFPEVWKSARALAKDIARARSFSRSMAETQQDLFTLAQPLMPNKPVTLAGVQTETPPKTVAPASLERPIARPDLPPFPELSAPEIDVRFEFEDFRVEQTSVASAAEIFLRRDYAR